MAGAPADMNRRVFQEVSFGDSVLTRRWAVATSEWHLIHTEQPDNTFELYDLRRDPKESRDRWGAPEGRELQAELGSWADEMLYLSKRPRHRNRLRRPSRAVASNTRGR